MTDDQRFMQRALDLAARARGLTSPNPMVGAVVVRDGTMIAEGFHRAAGEPHAEIEALGAAGVRARGATLCVTLEPCVHQGRTPPCAPAVIAAGVRRVVIASSDPNPRVSGRGIAALREAGIDVTTGVLEAPASALNRVFLTAMREGRPHVTLKAAATLDGKIADLHGMSKWITGEAARLEARRLRSEADAIVVGIGTVLADDPALTVRLDGPWPRQPLRVVLDSKARTPVSARVIQGDPPGHALVAVGAEAPAERIHALEAAGAQILRCPGADGRVSPIDLLAALAAREVRGVLVEGGAEVAAAFLEAGLIDRVAMFLAPLLLGGTKAPSVIAGTGRGAEARARAGGDRRASHRRRYRRRRRRPARLMFTGIVEELGTVIAFERRGDTARLAVAAVIAREGSGLGASVSVSGVCLTVVDRPADGLVFELGPETLHRTALGGLAPGRRVNLERPLRFGGALGGHLVLGHVDGVATVERVERVESTARVRIALPDRDLAPLLIPQGSVAVDGVSLTVASLAVTTFEVMLIPHTLTVTTFGGLVGGEAVNVETDVIGKYLQRSLALRGAP